jgi:hypothetical protein
LNAPGLFIDGLIERVSNNSCTESSLYSWVSLKFQVGRSQMKEAAN